MADQDGGLDGMEAFMGFFSDQGTDQIRRALDILELQMAMLPPDDQEFIVGTKAVFDTGGGISPAARKRVFQIAGRLTNSDHSLVSETPSLSLGKVIQDLASVQQQLAPQEMSFAVFVAKKLKARQPLTEKEISALCLLHKHKGF